MSKTGLYKCRLLLAEDPAFRAKPRPECSANFFLGRTHSFNLSFSCPRFVAWPRELGLGGRGEGGNTATLKTFFSAKTRKRYYRIHTCVPPNPQTHTS